MVNYVNFIKQDKTVLTTKQKVELTTKFGKRELVTELAIGLETICDNKTKFTEFETEV
jgi:hypothetical protein